MSRGKFAVSDACSSSMVGDLSITNSTSRSRFATAGMSLISTFSCSVTTAEIVRSGHPHRAVPRAAPSAIPRATRAR
jgi:hypothetical protein